MEKNGQSAYSKAYQAWFSEYETERRRRKQRKGTRLTGWPEPPTSPDDIAAMIDRIGPSSALDILGVHRSTLARWLSGDSVMPRSAWLILVLIADGRLPGMSDDWRDFRIDGDRLVLIGTRHSYSPREIAGWQYQTAHADALARRVMQLEAEKAHLLRIGRFDAANDALMSAGL